MTITCPECRYDNLDGTEFCDACGFELGAAAVAAPAVQTSPPQPQIAVHSTPLAATVVQTPTPQPQPQPQIAVHSTPVPVGAISATARLICKQAGSPIPEFAIDSSVLIGKFDPDMGPVDIDLEGFPGDETVSRNHAEIYQEAGVWKIKDLGSSNGVFIKPAGQPRFGARITMPEALNSGDEIAIAKVRFLFQTP